MKVVVHSVVLAVLVCLVINVMGSVTVDKDGVNSTQSYSVIAPEVGINATKLDLMIDEIDMITDRLVVDGDVILGGTLFSEFENTVKTLRKDVDKIEQSAVLGGTHIVIDMLVSDTDAERQAKVDAAPHHIHYNASLTFLFEDGIHVFTSTLQFNQFYGGGRLKIYGVETSNSQHENQGAIIQLASDIPIGISIGAYVPCSVRVYYLRFELDKELAESVQHSKMIEINNGLFVVVNFCSFWSTYDPITHSTNRVWAIYTATTRVGTKHNVFRNVYRSVMARYNSYINAKSDANYNTYQAFAADYNSVIVTTDCEVTDNDSDFTDAGGVIQHNSLVFN